MIFLAQNYNTIYILKNDPNIFKTLKFQTFSYIFIQSSLFKTCKYSQIFLKKMEPSKLDHCVISGIVTRTICKIYRPRKSNVNALTGIISKQ